MSIRSTIRGQFYSQIEEIEANSHFTATEANSLIDEAIRKIAKKVNFPRKFDSGTQAIAGTSDYDAASDYIYLVGAYFGDKTIADDIRPLIVVREQGIKYMAPAWLQTVSTSRGQPTHILVLDRNTHRLFPTPDATNSASGKKLWLFYVYEPVAMSADSDSPDLPLVYHDLIKFYAAGLAYDGKLANPIKAATNYSMFDKEVKETMYAGEVEAEESYRFKWGFVEE